MSDVEEPEEEVEAELEEWPDETPTDENVVELEETDDADPTPA
jgi:hypothetical protein